MRVQAEGLGKSFGSTRAVDALSFTVEPGRVTGFLGPNGAGKSTAMRLMLGLDRGEGRTVFDGRPLIEHPVRSRVVGAHLDARSFHPGRPARSHLRMQAAESRSSHARVDEVIDLVGLGSVADRSPRGFSLGMAQRLGLASAIVAEPAVLMLDEPANGLDPQSIRWLRDFLRGFAAEGRSVFVSSHLLSEMQLLADDLVIVAAGRLRAAGSLDDFVASNQRNHVRVRVSDRARLDESLRASGLPATQAAVDEEEGALTVAEASTDDVGRAAHAAGVVVLELAQVAPSLENVFLDLTSDAQQYEPGAGAS